VIRVMVFEDKEIMKLFSSSAANEMNMVNAVNGFVEFCSISGIGPQPVEVVLKCTSSQDMTIDDVIGARSMGTKDVKTENSVNKTDIGLITGKDPSRARFVTDRSQMFRISLKKKDFMSWEAATRFYGNKMLSTLRWLNEQQYTHPDLVNITKSLPTGTKLIDIHPSGKTTIAMDITVDATPNEVFQVMYGMDILDPNRSIILSADIVSASSVEYIMPVNDQDKPKIVFHCHYLIPGGTRIQPTHPDYPYVRFLRSQASRHGLNPVYFPSKTPRKGILLKSKQDAVRGAEDVNKDYGLSIYDIRR
jgi:hypothetical protein